MAHHETIGIAALDILADLIEPAIEIFGDSEFAGYIKTKQMPKAIRAAIKNHKSAVLDIMAVVDGADRETYNPGVFALPVKLLEILNDPDMMSLFRSAQETAETVSESVSENTGDENG